MGSRKLLIAAAIALTAAAQATTDGLTYTIWTEPNQKAFTLQVPKDWNITGGLTQKSLIEYRCQVVAASPDGLVTAQAGDETMLPFKQLTGTPFAIGGHFHQGSISEYHGWFMFLDYETGADFSKGYLNLILSKKYQDLKLGQSKDCPELTQALEQAFANSPVHAQISVGETDFAYTQNGKPMAGMCFATTVKDPVGGGWTAYPGICTAPANQIKEALEVLAHLALPHYSQTWAQNVNTQAGAAIFNLQATAYNDRANTDRIYGKYLKELYTMGPPMQNLLTGSGH
jgi:hypothetical protein